MLPRGNTRFKRWHKKRHIRLLQINFLNNSSWLTSFMIVSYHCTRSTHITHDSHATAAIHCNLWCLRRRAWTFGHFGEKFQEVLHVSLLAENNHDEGSWPKERPHKILRVDPKRSNTSFPNFNKLKSTYLRKFSRNIPVLRTSVHPENRVAESRIWE